MAGAIALILLVGAIALPGTRLFFQGNRVRYLANANQFNQALLEYERLAATRPAIATRLPDFETSVTLRAMQYYAQTRLPETEVERRAYGELKATLLAHQTLAPLARRMDLRVTSRRDGPTTPALEASRAILNHEGFELDALWWAVISREATGGALRIPEELSVWREALDALFIDPRRGNPVQAGRLSYLKGLLALDDGNWAEASYLFERYRRLAPDELTRTPGQAMAYGLALLRSGRSEAAIALLEPYTRREDPPLYAQGLLAEALLLARSYPWAAQSIHEIRHQGGRDAEKNVFKAAFAELEDELAGVGDPFGRLCARLTQPGAYDADVALWGWLASIAEDEPRRQAVDRAALALARRQGLSPEEAGALLEHALAWPLPSLSRAIIDGAAAPWRKDVFTRISRWASRRNQADAASLALDVEPLGLLLTHSTTRRIELELPAGASAIVLRVKGYPGRGVWPILHLDLGDLGRKTWYVADSSRSGRPLVFVLRRPLDKARSMEAVLSMLNGDPDGREDRNVVITDLYVF